MCGNYMAHTGIVGSLATYWSSAQVFEATLVTVHIVLVRLRSGTCLRISVQGIKPC